MSEIANWLEAQILSELALFAGQSPDELRQVIVNRAMTDAALDYIQSLYDPMMSTGLLEEVFRIMAVLQPKAPEDPQGLHSLVPKSDQAEKIRRPSLAQGCRAVLDLKTD